MFDIYSGDKESDAYATIEAFEEYFSRLGMPKTLGELGVKKEDIDGLVNKVTKNNTRTVYHHAKPINDEVARKIYYSCL